MTDDEHHAICIDCQRIFARGEVPDEWQCACGGLVILGSDRDSRAPGVPVRHLRTALDALLLRRRWYEARLKIEPADIDDAIAYLEAIVAIDTARRAG